MGEGGAGEGEGCVFGAEQMSFAGNARVERELLLELNGVLRLDRLVYRERRRIFTSGQFAWLLSHDSRMREFVPEFSQVGFLEEYLSQKRGRGLNIARVLADGRLPDDFSAIAILFDGRLSSKKNAA